MKIQMKIQRVQCDRYDIVCDGVGNGICEKYWPDGKIVGVDENSCSSTCKGIGSTDKPMKVYRCYNNKNDHVWVCEKCLVDMYKIPEELFVI